MRVLHHLWLSPFCRKVRLVLEEKSLAYDLRIEKVWERSEEFLALNPAGQIPVLVEPDGAVLSESSAICEYLEETVPDPALMPRTPLERAEVRRLVGWFDNKFHREVTRHLVDEKVMKRFMGMGEPDTGALRAAYHNVGYHLDYIGYLAERRKWLAGDTLSLADLTAAAHLSCIDYLGDVPWEDHASAKDWYARIKSRPGFRPLLGDHIPGLPPPRHYADLDF
jgi:glutathione S-transferase